MKWHQDSFAPPSRGRPGSGRRFGHPHDGLMGSSPKTTSCPAESPHQPFHQREMAFKSYTGLPSGPARSSAAPSPSRSLLKFSGVNDPYELEGWNPKLKLIREILLTREPKVAEYPTADRLYNTPDFSPQAQPCPGRERSSCITASTTWAQSERVTPRG
jgi:hypothetical protein